MSLGSREAKTSKRVVREEGRGMASSSKQGVRREASAEAPSQTLNSCSLGVQQSRAGSRMPRDVSNSCSFPQPSLRGAQSDSCPGTSFPSPCTAGLVQGSKPASPSLIKLQELMSTRRPRGCGLSKTEMTQSTDFKLESGVLVTRHRSVGNYMMQPSMLGFEPCDSPVNEGLPGENRHKGLVGEDPWQTHRDVVVVGEGDHPSTDPVNEEGRPKCRCRRIGSDTCSCCPHDIIYVRKMSSDRLLTPAPKDTKLKPLRQKRTDAIASNYADIMGVGKTESSTAHAPSNPPTASGGCRHKQRPNLLPRSADSVQRTKTDLGAASQIRNYCTCRLGKMKPGSGTPTEVVLPSEADAPIGASRPTSKTITHIRASPSSVLQWMQEHHGELSMEGTVQSTQPGKADSDTGDHQTTPSFSLGGGSDFDCDLNDHRMFMELVQKMSCELDSNVMCHHILSTVSRLLMAERASLFLVRCYKGVKYLVPLLFDVTADSRVTDTLMLDNQLSYYDKCLAFGEGIIGHAAESGQPVNCREARRDRRFEADIDRRTGFYTRSILAVPLFNNLNEVMGVAAVLNKMLPGKIHFSDHDLKLFKKYLKLCEITLISSRVLERNLNMFSKNGLVATLAQSIFKRSRDLEELIPNIMEEFVFLLNCERCILYLVRDSETLEPNNICSSCVCLSSGPCMCRKYLVKEQSTPTFCTVFDCKAYTNRKPDAVVQHQKLDATLTELARKLLTMPIFDAYGWILGVVQFINRRDDQPFTDSDVSEIEAVNAFFGLAIYNALVFHGAVESFTKQEMAFRAVSHHSPADAQEAMALEMSPVFCGRALYSLDFIDCSLPIRDTLRAVVTMFRLCEAVRYFEVPLDKLCRWVCCVSQNYRPQEYHSWRHAVNTLQSMFTLLNSATFNQFFSHTEIMGIIVGCLCHDLDHHEPTSPFLLRGSRLASLYTSIFPVRHHFTTSVLILKTRGHDIFGTMTTSEYSEALQWMAITVQAADLSVYFQHRDAFKEQLYNTDRSFQDKRNLMILLGMMMTASDLNSFVRPFSMHERHVQPLYYKSRVEDQTSEIEKLKEFYLMQVKFIDKVCLPVFEMLTDLKPCLESWYANVVNNKHIWLQKASAACKEIQRGCQVRLASEERRRKDAEMQAKKEKQGNAETSEQTGAGGQDAEENCGGDDGEGSVERQADYVCDEASLSENEELSESDSDDSQGTIQQQEDDTEENEDEDHLSSEDRTCRASEEDEQTETGGQHRESRYQKLEEREVQGTEGEKKIHVEEHLEQLPQEEEQKTVDEEHGQTWLEEEQMPKSESVINISDEWHEHHRKQQELLSHDSSYTSGSGYDATNHSSWYTWVYEPVDAAPGDLAPAAVPDLMAWIHYGVSPFHVGDGGSYGEGLQECDQDQPHMEYQEILDQDLALPATARHHGFQGTRGCTSLGCHDIRFSTSASAQKVLSAPNHAWHIAQEIDPDVDDEETMEHLRCICLEDFKTSRQRGTEKTFSLSVAAGQPAVLSNSARNDSSESSSSDLSCHPARGPLRRQSMDACCGTDDLETGLASGDQYCPPTLGYGEMAGEENYHCYSLKTLSCFTGQNNMTSVLCPVERSLDDVLRCPRLTLSEIKRHFDSSSRSSSTSSSGYSGTSTLSGPQQ